MDGMDPLRICNLCGCDSNETAVFNCAYAKNELNICLQCLTEGILEITKDMQRSKHKDTKSKELDFSLDEFDLTVPEQVFGFNCENCGSVIFTNAFPIECDCGHINNEQTLQNQDIIKRKK